MPWCSLLAVALRVAIAAQLLGWSAAEPEGKELGDSVKTRAKQQLELAEASAKSSEASVGEAKVHQQASLSDGILEDAEDAFDEARRTVPVAKASATASRVAMFNTKVALKDAQSALADMKNVAAEAAAGAGKMAMDMIKAQAQAEADKRAADDKANWGPRKDKILAGKVIGAMQPYHLALMRAQKAGMAAKMKADATIEGAKLTVKKAEEFAATAQRAQAGGHTYEANQFMMMAHGLMNIAQQQQGWAAKFQKTAEQQGGAAVGFQFQESGMAAALFPRLSQDDPMEMPGALLQEGARHEASAKPKGRRLRSAAESSMEA